MRSGHINEPRKAEKCCIREVRGETSSEGGVICPRDMKECGAKKDFTFARWGEEEEQWRHKAHYTEFRREFIIKICKRFL